MLLLLNQNNVNVYKKEEKKKEKMVIGSLIKCIMTRVSIDLYHNAVISE